MNWYKQALFLEEMKLDYPRQAFDGTFPIFINPTTREWREITSTKGPPIMGTLPGARVLIEESTGNVIAWSDKAYLHKTVENHLKQKKLIPYGNYFDGYALIKDGNIAFTDMHSDWGEGGSDYTNIKELKVQPNIPQNIGNESSVGGEEDELV